MSISTPTRKAGRPRQRYRTVAGEYIEGLSRYGDSRWRNSFTGRFWTEPDEGRAVEQFKEQMREAGLLGVPRGQRGYRGIAVHIASSAADFDTVARRDRGEEFMVIDLQEHGEAPTPGLFIEDEEGNILPDGRVLVMPIEPRPEQWDWIRRKIEENPVWVSQKLGIAEIANLQNVKSKQPSPSMREVIEVYGRRREREVTPAELGKCKSYWESLSKSLGGHGITTLRNWTKDAVSSWGESLVAKYKPKTVKHHILKVRSVLKEYRSTLDPGDRFDDAVHAAECLSCLRPPKQDSPDNAHAMEAKTFRALLDATEGFTTRKGKQSPHMDRQWRAMLLLAANACLYLKDLTVLRWDNLDLKKGLYSDARRKTGQVARGACLWKRTIKAVVEWRDAQESIGELVFPSPRGTETTSTVLGKVYNRLRERAEVAAARNTDFSAIRDRTYTTAYWAPDESAKYAQVLAGHRAAGIADAYVLRHPEVTKGVCKVVEGFYFPRKS